MNIRAWLKTFLVFGTVFFLNMQSASAGAQGVGLAVAAGINHYNPEGGDSGLDISWGFFVDIPLLDTFYIAPSCSIYEVNEVQLTDVDLNFKFIVPIGAIRLGAGVLSGLTTGLGGYKGHFGLLGYVSWKLVSNLDAFATYQFKHIPNERSVTNQHILGGLSFTF